MSEANIALLKRGWESYDKGDEEAFAACLTPDWKEYGSPNASSYGTLEDERRTMRELTHLLEIKHFESAEIAQKALEVEALFEQYALAPWGWSRSYRWR